ncbi:MAG: hypothetical protein AB8B62_02805 [Roseobacter sp.]
MELQKLENVRAMPRLSQNAMLQCEIFVHYFYSQNRELFQDARIEWEQGEMDGIKLYSSVCDPKLREAVGSI